MEAQSDIDPAARGQLSGQRGTVVWLTGLSGAGKSTIAGLVADELRRRERHCCVLDGDQVRRGLCSDLGFSAADRTENIRRVGEVARLMCDAGLIVLVSLISPFQSGRAAARALVGADQFFEVYVATPLEVVEQRDPKGLYRRARRGEIPDFTGIDSPYEPPLTAELTLDTVTLTPMECAARVLDALDRAGRLTA